MKKSLVFLLSVLCLFVSFGVSFAYTNPFADVPKTSWAISAVDVLASKGLVVGYPDGGFKGSNPATRYEVAAIVARTLANIDLNKASKQDLEMLKNLVVEFKDELDALGVKVNKIDSRVAVLENNVGGWKFNGVFSFRTDWSDNLSDNTNWNFNRARFQFSKRIDEKTQVVGRIRQDHTQNNEMMFDLFYADILFPWDVRMRVGKQNFDLVGAENLVTDNEPIFGNDYMQGFTFTKNFGMFEGTAYVAHMEDTDKILKDTDHNFTEAFNNVHDSFYNYGGSMKFRFNENFGVRAFGSMWNYENLNDFHIWGVNGFYNKNDDIVVNVTYWKQGLDQNWVSVQTIDTPAAVQASVNLSQKLLKFTDFTVEYTAFDRGWLIYNDMYGTFGKHQSAFADAFGTYGFVNDANSLFIGLNQKWNEKWTTHLRYANTKMDDTRFGSNFNYDDWSVNEYGIGVSYQYNPAVVFTLSYDKIDYSTGFEYNTNLVDDNIVRFETKIVF